MEKRRDDNSGYSRNIFNISKLMNDNKAKKRAYRKPETEVILIKTGPQPLCGSFQGGHNGDTSGGDLGDGKENGHTGGESGGGMGDAKQGFFARGEWGEVKDFSPWED